jgi:2'-5' RNA ligase
MVRIFIAIKISQPLEEKIHDFAKAHANLPVRWLAGKNLHITLVPPWETQGVAGVAKQLEEITPAGPFEITFDHVSFGPEKNAPRLIWAMGKASDALFLLKDRVEAAVGAERRRKFQMHATLARFKPHDFQNFPVQTLDERVHWSQPVTSFVIMESKLLPEGADYTILHEFPV